MLTQLFIAPDSPIENFPLPNSDFQDAPCPLLYAFCPTPFQSGKMDLKIPHRGYL